VQFVGAAKYYKFIKRNGFDKTAYYHPRYWLDGHWPAGGQESGARKELESDRKVANHRDAKHPAPAPEMTGP
jgi:hypothetical protein